MESGIAHIKSIDFCGLEILGYKMAFNIQLHIKDHASLIIDNLNVDKDEQNFVHFTCSVDTALCISKGYDTQEKIDNVMEKMLEEVSNLKIEVTEKNGSYTTKDNKKIPRNRTRIIKFDGLLSAYHNQHFDNSKIVNPHFHFLGHKNARLGLNFTYLRQAIKQVSEQYGLTFHFADTKRDTGLTKKQEASVKSMSWLFNEGNKEKIINYLSDESRLEKSLNLLYTHYQHSKNISYFLKIMSIVNQRLSEFDVDYWYKDINLKESIYFSLSEEQIEMIETLKNNEEITLDMTKVFDREVLKYAHGFGSDSMNIVVDKFNILKIDTRKLMIKSFDKTKIDTNQKSNFKSLVCNDINNAIDNAKNEKELKELMLEMGYKKVSFKTSKTKDNKRKKTGLSLVTKKQMKMTMNFSEIGKSWSDITIILMKNQKKKKKKVVLKSQVSSYKRKKTELDEELRFFRYKVRLLLTIYCNVEREKQKVEHLASHFNVIRSEMYDITTFKSKDTTIVDYSDKIVLKKSASLSEDVSDMLKLVILKGWELDSLTISGDMKFVNECKKQINKLKSIGLRRSKHKNNAPTVL